MAEPEPTRSDHHHGCPLGRAQCLDPARLELVEHRRTGASRFDGQMVEQQSGVVGHRDDSGEDGVGDGGRKRGPLVRRKRRQFADEERDAARRRRHALGVGLADNFSDRVDRQRTQLRVAGDRRWHAAEDAQERVRADHLTVAVGEDHRHRDPFDPADAPT